MPPSPTLAQSAAAAVAVLPWIGALILFVLVAGFAVMALRKRLLNPTDTAASPRSIFEDLEAMHARGDLSDDELAAAKRSLALRLAGRPSEKAPRPDHPPPDDKPGG